MNHREFMNYIANLVIDEIDLRGYEKLDDEEIDEIRDYVLDNDCDIINTMIEAIFSEILDEYIEDIYENRYKTYAVTFKWELERTLNIRAKRNCNINQELFDNEMFYSAVEQILINDGYGEIETTWINEVNDETCDIDLEKEDY